MQIINENFIVSARGFDDAIDLTQKVKDMVKFNNIENGLINIFVASSTSALIITEQEPGIMEDIKKLISFMIPVNKVYEHDVMWYEGNGYSYLRASLFQKSISLPIKNNEIMLDKYQQIILLDFNNAPSSKNIIATIISDTKDNV